MLGFKSLSESSLSTYGALPELLNNATIRGTAKLEAVGNILNYLGNISFTAIADLEAISKLEAMASGEITASALLECYPNTVEFTGYINIEGEAVFYCKGAKVGEGWVRVVPDTEEWTNTTNW